MDLASCRVVLLTHRECSPGRRSTLHRQPRSQTWLVKCQDAALADLNRVLDDELRRLPEKYRVPVVLCYLEGQSQDEAARQLGWTKGTVSGRLARARAILQRRLVRRGLAPAAALAGAALGSDAVAAALGAPLVASTVRTATLASFAGLKTGSITTEVAALVRAAVRAMLLGRIAKVSAFLLIFMVGASAVATQILGPEWPAGHRRSDGKQPPVPTPANFERPAPRLDRFGHPLPPGVVTRLGTTQRRHTARVVSVGFSIDGAAAITCQVDGLVRFWDAENGSQRELIDLTSGTYGDHLSIRQVAMSRDGRYLAAAGFLRNAAAGNRGDRVWILSLPAVRVVRNDPDQDDRSAMPGVLARWYDNRHRGVRG